MKWIIEFLNLRIEGITIKWWFILWAFFFMAWFVGYAMARITEQGDKMEKFEQEMKDKEIA